MCLSQGQYVHDPGSLSVFLFFIISSMKVLHKEGALLQFHCITIKREPMFLFGDPQPSIVEFQFMSEVLLVSIFQISMHQI